METSAFIEKDVDPERDILLDFDKTYTHYTRFNGRHQDENLEFDEVLTVLLPAHMETTNVLQFQLVLLESITVPKDYVIGWNAFPLLNSDFKVNQGRFKVPLMFGTVNPNMDKFRKVEEQMKRDLDLWIGNLYFEIEKVNLIDLKVDPKSDKLYYQPVNGITVAQRHAIEELIHN